MEDFLVLVCTMGMKTTTNEMSWNEFLGTDEGKLLYGKVAAAQNSLALGKRKYREIGASWDMGLFFAFPNTAAMKAHADYCERKAAEYAGR